MKVRTLEYKGHIRIDGNGRFESQSLKEHNIGAAEITQNVLSSISLQKCGYLAGLYHDIGKYTEEYQNYLEQAVRGENVIKGSVIHSFTGVRFFLDIAKKNTVHDANEVLTSQLIAYAIGAHHGLFDCVDDESCSGFDRRINYPNALYEEAINNMWREYEPEQVLLKELHEASGEVQPIVKIIEQMSQKDPTNEQNNTSNFYVGLLVRLLTSAVMEGDRRDTMQFMSRMTLPDSVEDKESLWNRCLNNIENKLEALPKNTPISKARSNISHICSEKGKMLPPGVFRLNIPTGAGKTLSSLRFAVEHAKKWNKNRIILTSPLLSILEQNAEIVKQYIGDDSLILEHHSDVVKTANITEEIDDYKNQELKYLEDSWSAPIIITTQVQFLNTLFSGKSSSVRRFHSLCNSVIVLDEVQTIPMKMLSLFNLAVNFLCEVCNATIVLCSATQPCLEETRHPIISQICDMVPYDEKLWTPFKRTTLYNRGKCRMEDIPTLAAELMEEASSLLIICNKKDEARKVYQELSKGPWECVHISAAMCPQHRRDTINRMKHCLGKCPIICVSTQVIEAGVDISFQKVIRFVAGMDNAVQAAGRCNRNGEIAGIQPVYLVNCIDEKLDKLPEIQKGKTATLELLETYRRTPDLLTSDEAVRGYYKKLYGQYSAKYQDYQIEETSIYSLLSTNLPPKNQTGNMYMLNQAFSKAGKLFQVFNQDTFSVLCPYGEGVQFVEKLNSGRAEHELQYVKKILEMAKPYFVNLYSYQIEALQDCHALSTDQWNRVYIMDEAFYHGDIGFSLENPQNEYLEV